MQKYENDFYVYLISNGSVDLYPNNTASEFRNQIQVPIDFGSQMHKWEVGLSELQIPSTFYNVTKSVNTFSIRYKTEDGEVEERQRSSRKRRAVGTPTLWTTTDIWRMDPSTFPDVESFFKGVNDSMVNTTNKRM